MIARRPFVYDTFDWQDFGEVVLHEEKVVVKTHTCEQIFAENDSSDGDIMDPASFLPDLMNQGGASGAANNTGNVKFDLKKGAARTGGNGLEQSAKQANSS